MLEISSGRMYMHEDGMENQERWLMAINGQGVADRINDLLLACRIGKIFNRKVHFIWPVNRGCGARFEIVFRSKVNFLQVAEERMLRDTKSIGPVDSHGNSSYAKACEEAACLNEHPNLYLTPRYRGHDYGDFDNINEASREVKAKVEEFIRLNWTNSVVGVHIRRTDKISLGAPDFPQYAHEMDKVLQAAANTSFFVASDDTECVNRLATRYGRRIFYYPVRDLRRDRSDSIVDAVTVLFLLRSTVGVIGSKFSGFSLCGGWGRSFTNVASTQTKNYPWNAGGFDFPTVLDALGVSKQIY